MAVVTQTHTGNSRPSKASIPTSVRKWNSEIKRSDGICSD